MIQVAVVDVIFVMRVGQNISMREMERERERERERTVDVDVVWRMEKKVKEKNGMRQFGSFHK